jgi:hypothetical protein
MTVSRTSSPTEQLAGFVNKYDPAVAKLARSLRAAMRKRLPTANELVYDNYQFLAIGYSSTEKASDTIVSLAVSPKGVALCFYYGAKLPDPAKILYGGGNQVRFARLESAATLAKPALATLIRVAAERGKVPLPKGTRGKLIIKSISAKQRPRRKS